MAVTIDEMHVEVKDTPAPPSATPEVKTEKPADLRSELEKVRERNFRLRAD
jgi:hypothetical protein